MEGSEEVASRLAHGASSLFGHTIGSSSKSASLLNQSLGDLATTLSFDDEYKKKRKFGKYNSGGKFLFKKLKIKLTIFSKLGYGLQKSSDLPESLILAGQTYIMGVALGLSGIIMKPIFGNI